MTAPIRLIAGDAEAPRNQWYVIAFSDEVSTEPLGRMILGDPVVLYRREDQRPVALFDRCPHRGMRFSNGGKVVEDTIRCNYHGLEFGSDGICSKIPSSGAISNQMRVHSYPLAEIWKWIWIWPGDPAKADRALIPDHHALGLTDPSMHAYSGLFLKLDCNYLHAYENLVEATHVSYLHHGFIDNGNVAAHPFHEEVAEDRITTVREFRNELVSPYAKISYGLQTDIVDRELWLTAIPPAVTVITEKYFQKHADTPGELIARLVVPVTPAARDRCYQFVAAVRTFPTEVGPLFEGLRSFLMEDVTALADVQQLFDSLTPERRVEVSVRSDNPALRARRIIEKMVDEERRNQAAAAA